MSKYKEGLTKEEVLDKIGRDKWMDFTKWFVGQTGAIAEDGTLLYYPWDVEKYLKIKEKE